jgi:hypothetical protein
MSADRLLDAGEGDRSAAGGGDRRGSGQMAAAVDAAIARQAPDHAGRRETGKTLGYQAHSVLTLVQIQLAKSASF